ncbi:hypothetical protein NHG23_08670 [Aerococcaceae bacterium NML190073]|nr:hypothetical protein [Aerococcaceae bacterium NML190073]
MSKTLKRQMNYQTRYFIAPATLEKTALRDQWKELAEGIQSIEEESDVKSEKFEYYAHRGSSEEVVGSVSRKYKVTGHRLVGDEAQDEIAKKEWETGDDRVVWFKILEPDNTYYVGKATVTSVKVRSGDANGFAPFESELAYNGKPEKGNGEI